MYVIYSIILCTAIKSFLFLVFPRRFFPDCLYGAFRTESASRSIKNGQQYTVMRILSRKRPRPETRASVTSIECSHIDKPA